MCLVSVTFRYPLYCFDGSGASQPGNDWISSAAACAVAGGAVIASAALYLAHHERLAERAKAAT